MTRAVSIAFFVHLALFLVLSIGNSTFYEYAGIAAPAVLILLAASYPAALMAGRIHGSTRALESSSRMLWTIAFGLSAIWLLTYIGVTFAFAALVDNYRAAVAAHLQENSTANLTLSLGIRLGLGAIYSFYAFRRGQRQAVAKRQKMIEDVF